MKRVIKLLAVLPALLGIWFFLAVFSGVFNIANISGMVFCAAAAAVLLNWDAARRLLNRLWGKRGLRVLLIGVSVVLAVLIVVLGVLSALVIGGMRQPETDAETVIVLGCQVHGAYPSKLLDHRIESAAEYLKAHPDSVCIASGGRGSGEDITESECIRRGLVARGIDPARILTEDASTTTLENLAFSKRLMEEQGLSGPVLLVTSNFHLYRALQMAQALGLEAGGLPASCEWMLLPTYVLREAMALVKFRLGG